MPRAQGCAGAATPGDFCLGKSHQNRFAPKGFAGFAGALASSVGLRRCAYGLSLAPDAHVRDPSRNPVGLDFGLSSTRARLRGRKKQSYQGFMPLGPVWRAHAAQAFGRVPSRARKGSRAWTVRTGMSCRDTAKPKARTRGVVAPSGFAFLLVTFLWRGKEKLPAVGQPPTSGEKTHPEAARLRCSVALSAHATCSRTSADG